MGRPITDKDRRAVCRHHAAGMARNEIARKIGRSPSTVSKLAAEAGLTFDRGPEVVAATEARRIDLAARRITLAEQLHQDAEKLREQLWQPCTVGAFGGKDNVWNDTRLEQPTFGDQRQILAAAGTAIEKSFKLAPPAGGEGAGEVVSMLGQLGEALTRAAADGDDDGSADGG
ncbi:helix-turn-helix domain-containing protein [Streptomyces sp. NBC_01180]|uniref:helix-turn-helix domain-containing protein n=1 Tax=Streptomyces sp. NBC_01180 TaxID=2903763 RepID=UPI0038634AAA|nr:helix-turn-helix domain-containing protein [Streptomyces sp. NBC_01180]